VSESADGSLSFDGDTFMSAASNVNDLGNQVLGVNNALHGNLANAQALPVDEAAGNNMPDVSGAFDSAYGKLFDELTQGMAAISGGLNGAYSNLMTLFKGMTGTEEQNEEAVSFGSGDGSGVSGGDSGTSDGDTSDGDTSDGDTDSGDDTGSDSD
jgi:hypothetical protein